MDTNGASLRCKPGDLAVVVRSDRTPQMMGHFVIVERLISHGETIGRYRMHIGNLPVWQVRSAVTGALMPWPSECGLAVHMVRERAFLDNCLRPIRPNDGIDETLTDARFRIEEVA